MNDANESKCFLLAGNGPVTNRGCQAILLGTYQLLKGCCPESTFISASFGLDSATEIPADVKSVRLPLYPARWSYRWLKTRIQHRLGIPESRRDVLKPLKPILSNVNMMLSVGGDNYAIDYGYEVVERLILAGHYAKRHGIPVVLWGASIGPFDKDPAFEARIAKHLTLVDLIVVREVHSLRYLHSLGLSRNVVLAPDPSYLMRPEVYPVPEPIAAMLKGEVVGINLSTLLARYVTKGNLDEWIRIASQLVQRVSQALKLPVILIPHVYCPPHETWIDDAQFMRRVLEALPSEFRDKVALLPGRPSAPELKWIIAKTSLLIGARTHSTLAALSSHVPCLSLAYSLKAKGINESIFGHNDWCIEACHLTPSIVADKAVSLYNQRDAVRQHLAVQGKDATNELFSVGRRLCGMLKE